MPKNRHWRRRHEARQRSSALHGWPNNSMIVTFNIEGQNRTFKAIIDHIPQEKKPYDAEGATLYVVAVIVIYGVSIILMILATVRGRRQYRYLDQQISSYFKDVERIRKKAMANSVINQSISIAASQTRLDSSTNQLDSLPLILESSEPSPDVQAASGQFFPNDSASSLSTPALSQCEQQFDVAGAPRRFEKGILRSKFNRESSLSAESSPASSRSVKFRHDYGVERGALRHQLKYHIDSLGVLRPKLADYIDNEDTVSAPNSPGLARVQFKPLGQQLGRRGQARAQEMQQEQERTEDEN